MRSNRRRDTGPELRLRRALHAMGLRYRVDLAVRPDGGRPVRPDVAFTRARVAVFVDGCFWHQCPLHGSRPKANAAWWEAKLERNVHRDARDTVRMASAGWEVVRAWEHEDPAAVAQVVAQVVAAHVARTGSRP